MKISRKEIKGPFNLLNLHDKKKDITPHRWIWARFDTSILKQIYESLLERYPQNEISRLIKSKVNAGFSTIVKHLTRLKKSDKDLWLPLVLVKELLILWKNERKLDQEEFTKLQNKIINSFHEFKSSGGTNKIKAVKDIDTTIAKVIGAYVADGYSKEEKYGSYSIRLTDYDEVAVKKFSSWAERLFSYKPSVNFNEKDNEWVCWIYNKIIGRYIEKIFKIPLGKKSHFAFEPQIIKCSPIEIRKSFALGVFTFDGGVKTNGMIGFTSKSRDLIDDLIDIISKDKLNLNPRFNKKRELWICESESGREKKILKKWLSYFEPKTIQWWRIYFFAEENPKITKEKLFEIFPPHRLGKTSLKKVFEAIKTIGSGNIDAISTISEDNHQKLSKITLYKYLFILHKAGLISKHYKTVKNGNFGWREVIYQFNGEN